MENQAVILSMSSWILRMRMRMRMRMEDEEEDLPGQRPHQEVGQDEAIL